MDIRLMNIRIENLAGIKFFEENFDGKDIIIKAENRRGKTTIYTSVLWLLFGKNAEGKSDSGKSHFELRPLDSDNQPIKGLVVSVTAIFNFDGIDHTFKKEQHELNVKGQFKGYTNKYWIDDVPKLEKDYNSYIDEIIPENTFKMLTNLNYFSEELPWEKRRAVLFDIKGQTGTPEGFDELLSQLKGRSIKDYKKVLSDEKKNYKEAQAKIGPQIGENQRMLDEYITDDLINESTLKKKRDSIKSEIAGLDEKRKSLFDQEQDRLQKIDYVNSLKIKKAEREVELLNDTSGIQSLLDKKAEIEKRVAVKKQLVADANGAFNLKQSEITGKKNEINKRSIAIDSIREEYSKAEKAPTDNTCYACGQKLPADRIKEIAEKRETTLAHFTEQGNKIFREVESLKVEMAALDNESKQLLKNIDVVTRESADAQINRDKEFATIDRQIKNNTKTPPENDLIWLEICDKIKKVQKEIGEPASEQLQAIDTVRTAKMSELEKINNTLAQSDTRTKNAARIKELEQDEKRLAQAIANVEKQLADIDQYNIAESNLIESSVNSKFLHVKFKLFHQLLSINSDGERQIEMCCEAMLDGKPYGAMSGGEKIFVGIDIINTLSRNYQQSVPLFIDNAESFSLPNEAESQVIELYMQKGINKLTIEKKGENHVIKKDYKNAETTGTNTTKCGVRKKVKSR